MKHLKSLVISLLLMAAPQMSLSATVTYAFTGHITSVDYELSSYYSVGQTLSGTVVVDSLSSGVNIGYGKTYKIEYVDYTIGNVSDQHTHLQDFAVVSNGDQYDEFGVWINPVDSPVIYGHEWFGYQLQLWLTSPDTSVLNSDMLVTGDLFSLFSGNGSIFMEYDCFTCDPFGGGYAYPAFLWGEITSLTGVSVVPLPASILLFGSGVLGLGAFSRRRRI